MRDPADGRGLLSEASGQCAGSLRVEALDVTRCESFLLPQGLRVLVNNAGADGAWLPVEHAPLTLWRELFETNVFGLVDLSQRAIPALRAAGGGVLCNITSCSIFAPMSWAW